MWREDDLSTKQAFTSILIAPLYFGAGSVYLAPPHINDTRGRFSSINIFYLVQTILINNGIYISLKDFNLPFLENTSDLASKPIKYKR